MLFKLLLFFLPYLRASIICLKNLPKMNYLH